MRVSSFKDDYSHELQKQNDKKKHYIGVYLLIFRLLLTLVKRWFPHYKITSIEINRYRLIDKIKLIVKVMK